MKKLARVLAIVMAVAMLFNICGLRQQDRRDDNA